MIAVQEIHNVDELEALRPEWSALWNRCPSATPFQTPEWLLPWWELFGTGQLAALAFRSGGTLAGVAPFWIDGGVLRLMGAGISDYLDVLVAPECRKAAAEALWRHVLQLPWQRCEFTDLPPDSLLLETPPPRLEAVVRPCAVCPVLTLPPARRRSIRRYRRFLGPLENASAQTLDEFLDALFRLHGARWSGRGGSGVLTTPVLQVFHRRAAAGLLAAGRLLLCGVRLEGSLAAVIHGFQGHGRIWTYLSGFDPAAARFSPGTVAMSLALEQAARAGCREADFLRGDERYKYAWGARNRSTFRLEARLRAYTVWESGSGAAKPAWPRAAVGRRGEPAPPDLES
jgi:CelD/BcsL family acetyltransferase involved in cellulose biosynthesis